MPYKPGLRGKSDDEVQELVIPPPGQMFGGLNKYDTFSRYTINDSEFDDLINLLPMGASMRQVPGQGTTLATLISTIVWMSSQFLNNATYLFCLCTNGHLYQVATAGGAITDISGGISANADIANWQGTTILISDPNVSVVSSWTGSVFATALTGVQWSQIEVFNNRVWGSHNNVLSWTNIGTFNSLGGDSGTIVITDSTVIQPIAALVSFGGLLYLFGPDYIMTLGNTQSAGTPAVLLFTITILETQIGTNSQWSIVAVGNVLYFSNSYGFWKLSGSLPIQISAPMDGFFQNFQPASTFSGGYTEIYGMPIVGWHGLFDSEAAASVFCATSQTISQEQAYVSQEGGTQWFRWQSGALTFITSSIIAGVPTMWGTDGTNIFSLFINASAPVTSSFTSKFWSFGNPVSFKKIYKIAVANVLQNTASYTLTIYDANGNVVKTTTNSYSNVVQWINNAGQIVTWINNSLAPVQWTTSNIKLYNVAQYDDPNTLVRILGINFSITSTQATIVAIMIEWENSSAGWGS
jgi:hypothetical protein